MSRSSTTWQKGCPAPNPGGRPKAALDLQALAREHTPEALATLVKIMRNDDHPQQGWAADKLLDRAWGKPVQPTVQTSTDKSFEEWMAELADDTRKALDDELAVRRHYNGNGTIGNA